MTNNVEIFYLEHPVLIKYALIDRYPFENCLKHLPTVCFYSVFTIITMNSFEHVRVIDWLRAKKPRSSIIRLKL